MLVPLIAIRLLIKSDLVKTDGLKEILESSSDFIESGEYPNWERYFTHLLTSLTQGYALCLPEGRAQRGICHPRQRRQGDGAYRERERAVSEKGLPILALSLREEPRVQL